MKVIRQCEANVELDGPEVVRTYLETGKITFGSSTLLPGQTGGIDSGHPQSHEVFFVSRCARFGRSVVANLCKSLTHRPKWWYNNFQPF